MICVIGSIIIGMTAFNILDNTFIMACFTTQLAAICRTPVDITGSRNILYMSCLGMYSQNHEFISVKESIIVSVTKHISVTGLILIINVLGLFCNYYYYNT